MKLSEAKSKLRVAYIPGHAHGDINHPDVEYGLISSWNHIFIFVKFNDQLNVLGWDCTSQACSPDDLRIVK